MREFYTGRKQGQLCLSDDNDGCESGDVTRSRGRLGSNRLSVLMRGIVNPHRKC